MNLLNPMWDGEVTLPDGTSACAVPLARHAGAARLGATHYGHDPGAAAPPLQYHHRNEDSCSSSAARPHRAQTSPPRVLICSTNELPEIAQQVKTAVTVLLTDDGAWPVPPGAAQELTQP